MPALLAVAVAGPLSVSELARRLGLGLSTTSAIVGQLSRAGLLERAEDDADRRRTIVRLHDEHSRVIGGWAKQALAPLRRTLERLTPQARAQFIEGWRILNEEVTRGARS
jgi:DNA-binding MarR family transcriptional regulator